MPDIPETQIPTKCSLLNRPNIILSHANCFAIISGDDSCVNSALLHLLQFEQTDDIFRDDVNRWFLTGCGLY